MLYLTHTRLMSESETSVLMRAEHGEGPDRRICAQLIASKPRYFTWIASHDKPMWSVARARQRESQIVALRLVATHQIHRAALVRHFRDDGVTARDRVKLLAEFYGPLDTDCATLAEHRSYTQAVSSEISATDLLAMIGDRHGLELLEAYQQAYGTYFAMHCDRILARHDHRPYLLASLLPEVRSSAVDLRKRLVAGADSRLRR